MAALHYNAYSDAKSSVTAAQTRPEPKDFAAEGLLVKMHFGSWYNLLAAVI